MMVKLLKRDTIQNEIISPIIRPLVNHIYQVLGSSAQGLRELEYYRDLKIRLYLDIKGLGRLYVLSPYIKKVDTFSD